jgi:hypothetical protein
MTQEINNEPDFYTFNQEKSQGNPPVVEDTPSDNHPMAGYIFPRKLTLQTVNNPNP